MMKMWLWPVLRWSVRLLIVALVLFYCVQARKTDSYRGKGLWASATL